MKILVTRRISNNAIARLKSSFEVDYIAQNKPLDRSYLMAHLKDYDGVLCCVSERIDAGVMLGATPRLKAISNMAVGLDNIDLPRAKELGIRVFNTPGIVTDSTADMTVALGLSLIRDIANAFQYVKNSEWRGWDPEIFIGRTIQGLHWGIIGFGAIGQAVARRVHGFGARIIYYDPYKNIDLIGNGIPVAKVDLNKLLGTADIISLHVPLEEATTNLIGPRQFGEMKNKPVFINMARGKVVDTAALLEALERGRIAGAALDVFDPEPLDGGHEILKMKNVITTPHIGTATRECRELMALRAAENLIDFFELHHE